MRKIVLLSCAKSQVPYKTKARNLYSRSPLFCKSLAYAESLQPDEIFVISTKHGLIKLEEEFEPYNVAPKDLKGAKKAEWQNKIRSRINSETDVYHDHYILLTNKENVNFLKTVIKNFETPLDGLGIGKRQQWLDAHTV